MGQLAPQAPQAAYEGQHVSAISLIANPHRNLQPLDPYVTQKAGQPYSQEKIEASAQALQKAGQFPEVHVNVTPEITGLRISFLLEPAYYLGVIEFPGATKKFSYTRLLQVVEFGDQDPYDPSRLPDAEKALLNFLHHNGYFTAQVHEQSQIDDAHELVNLSFVVDTGKQARIGSITLEGPTASEDTKLLHSVHSIVARLSGGLLKKGKPYSPERMTAATSRMKKALIHERRLAASVKENPAQYHADTNLVDVSFKVEVGPVVTVRASGAKLSFFPPLAKREMRKLIPIYSEASVDQELVDEGRRNLTDFFQKKGYYNVKVTSKLENQPDQILVEYTIDRGEKYKVAQIAFHGNYALTQKELTEQVTVKKAHLIWHGSLSQKLLKQSADNITALYADHGYEKAKVTSQAVDHGKKMDVSFEIEEGPQTVVENVAISGNQNVPYAQLIGGKGFNMRSGVPFSPRKVTEDRNRISATYLDRGYLNAEVKATVQPVAGNAQRVNVNYVITERQQVRIDQVVYLGQKHTRVSLIDKTANIPPETPMRRLQLMQAESRLYDLSIFDWASVGPREPIIDQKSEDTLVKVHEAKRNEITYGLGFEAEHRGGNIPTGTVALPGGGATIGLGNNQIAPSQQLYWSPRGLIEFTRRNMRGLGETYTASILGSRLDNKALTSYAQPRFMGWQWSSLSSVQIERTSENPLFTASLGDISFQLEHILNHKKNTRLQIRYDFNKTDLSHLLVPELVLPQDLNVHLSTVSATFIRDTRDHPLDAHHGEYTTVNFGVTPTAFGSSANFTKLFVQHAFYKPVKSTVFANSIRLGFAAPFSASFVPTSQLFFSGGGTTLRGFPIDEAGPQRLVPFCNVLQGQSGCVDVTVPVGGKELFILNSEERFPLGIVKPLGGVVFYDGGNVFSAINLNNFVNNYSNTVGVGLRYSTPIGPVRFDLGRNLNPLPGINAWQYYITIGQAF